MSPSFDHEKLKVYQSALDFVVFTVSILTNLPKRVAVWDQLDCNSASIALNIAKGNGRFTAKDRCPAVTVGVWIKIESRIGSRT
ncbi:MAG: four helix bundle protein [Opitutales bacterium]